MGLVSLSLSLSLSLFLVRTPWEESPCQNMTMLAPWSWTSSLQKYNIYLCHPAMAVQTDDDSPEQSLTHSESSIDIC
jgi:hypothetical protein